MSAQVVGGCVPCHQDRRALDAWRDVGGAYPVKVCTLDHRRRCVHCGGPVGFFADDANADKGYRGKPLKGRVCSGCRAARGTEES